jgi:hypothetical protein
MNQQEKAMTVLKTASPRRLQRPSPTIVHLADPNQVYTQDRMEWEMSKMPSPRGRTTPVGVVVTNTGMSGKPFG